MSAVLAALPIVIALALLLLQAGPVRGALAGVVSAFAIAMLAFPAPLPRLLAAQIDMAPVALEVALILLGGLILSNLMSASGAQERLGHWVIAACRNQIRAVLLVVLGVIPFAESVTGFGIGVVVGIPLLVQIGLSGRRAAVVGLLGLVTVPWGALAPGTLVASRLAGVDFQGLGVASAWLSGPVFLVAGAGAVIVAFGWRMALRSAPDLFFAVILLWLGVWGSNTLIGTPLAGVLGSLFTIAILLLRARFSGPGQRTNKGRLLQESAPYLILVAGLLAAKALSLVVSPAFLPALEILGSPATWLFLASATIPMVQKLPANRARTLTTASAKQWHPIALTTVLFLILGVILAASGMSEALANAGARAGYLYPAIAPWIGALGGFLTGSNTGASAMFAASQAQAAQVVGYPVPTLVALHNVGASLAMMAAIPKVMMSTRLAEDATGQATDPVRQRISTSAVFVPVAVINVAILAILSVLALLLAP
ncbi:L-lactate permease [Pelagivirga sediminicola]|uniref:L-lactate permease n=1 Tax=Pelagivirga sediminicola TaxID=2170575 RepID=A0A2T7G9F9_9RHOB|nr:L-lactate permease [Pelagivirga sediminicola]PVA11036.1 L-lactate permease [Pelagivirga sediminicola]